MAGDKLYDKHNLVAEMRCLGRDTAHGAAHEWSPISLDGRTAHQAGYAVSQRIRKRIEDGLAG